MSAALTFLVLSISAFLMAQDPEASWKAASPDGSYIAATRRIPDKGYIWRDDLYGFRLVVFPLTPGPEHNTGKLYFTHDFPGRVPMQAQWSPNSRFLVLTTTSSGGHSPWHYTTYIFSVAHRKIVSRMRRLVRSYPRTSCSRLSIPSYSRWVKAVRTAWISSIP